MDDEKIDSDPVMLRWFIDLDWHQPNERSFFSLVENCLCPECRSRLAAGDEEVAAADLVTTIKDCCSTAPGFITGRLPLLASVFRLFLANGNRPLDLNELGAQLSKQRGGDTYRTSVEVLSRLLQSDRYYGLRPVAA